MSDLKDKFNFKDLLQLYFEYKYYWLLYYKSARKPIEIRRRQIEALFKAFSIKCEGNFSTFENGDFIEPSGLKNNHQLKSKIKVIAEKYMQRKVEEGYLDTKPFNNKYVYLLVFRYRIKLFRTITIAPPGIDLGNYNFNQMIARNFQIEAKDALNPVFNEIDELLKLLIGIENETVSKKNLVENFDYPSIETKNIDKEFFTAYYKYEE